MEEKTNVPENAGVLIFPFVKKHFPEPPVAGAFGPKAEETKVSDVSQSETHQKEERRDKLGEIITLIEDRNRRRKKSHEVEMNEKAKAIDAYLKVKSFVDQGHILGQTLNIWS